MTHPCPSCAAPLDGEGICTACGALTRGFFRDLELGTPQLAQAVANGLDFYLLLGVEPAADVRAVARRYRQLRVLFPDDPSRLASEPARRLQLLELAGRALTDPRLRASYDALRAEADPAIGRAVLRCASCGAPLPADAARCDFCGSARPAAPQAPAAPPETADPAAEPIDYYALLGLTPTHLLPPDSASRQPARAAANVALGGLLALPLDLESSGASLPPGPPSPTDVDAACLARQKALLLAPGYTPEEREARVDELEIARRILRADQRRSRYDMLLLSYRQGLYGGGRLDALKHLQDLMRAELAEERGEQLSPEAGAALLRQGQGYLSARLPREALEPLRRAVATLPRSPEAHAAYVQALLGSDDPLALGGYTLRMALRSLDTLKQLGAATPAHAGLGALCRGLLARDEGSPAAAEAELRQALALDPGLAPAWRGLAALALGRGDLAGAAEACRKALALDPRDERALLMLCGAYLRAGQRNPAREAASQVAALRGEGWAADAVLRELTG